ncbi:uncharacterized protein LOC142319986 [Lycorma delicatula]|uniref:uncharacterized protein LOC142319986 n=1 Tax=Lycorma delicatula TaxID=130591 RepID=UPI003F5108E4
MRSFSIVKCTFVSDLTFFKWSSRNFKRNLCFNSRYINFNVWLNYFYKKELSCNLTFLLLKLFVSKPIYNFNNRMSEENEMLRKSESVLNSTLELEETCKVTNVSTKKLRQKKIRDFFDCTLMENNVRCVSVQCFASREDSMFVLKTSYSDVEESGSESEGESSQSKREVIRNAMLQQHLFVVKTHNKNEKCLAETVRKSHTHFGRYNAPSWLTVEELIKKFECRNSLEDDIPRLHQCSGQFTQNTTAVIESVTVNSKTSIHHLA